jgi:hypothetical protein
VVFGSMSGESAPSFPTKITRRNPAAAKEAPTRYAMSPQKLCLTAKNVASGTKELRGAAQVRFDGVKMSGLDVVADGDALGALELRSIDGASRWRPHRRPMRVSRNKYRLPSALEYDGI